MRLIPSMFTKLHALNWRQSLSALGYQRVQLRIMLISMLLTLPILPLILAYSLYTRADSTMSETTATVLVCAAVVVAAFMLITLLWVCGTIIKISLMRWRGLGFKGAGMVGMMLASFALMALINVAGEIGQSPELLLTGAIPLWVYQWLGLAVALQIVQALLSYWMYFEETPLQPLTATLQEPYATTPGRFESALLFVQQIWVWFSILTVPMYFVVAHFNA